MRYLKPRGKKWHYVRRVPTQFSAIDARGLIQASLKTSSLDVAKLRRDAMERADDLFWQGMSVDDAAKSMLGKYQAAKARAVALGFEYKSAVEIADASPVEEIIRRIAAATQSPRDEVAALGGTDEPKLTVRQAMELYTEELAMDELRGMSEGQIESWRKVKFISVDMYEEVIGVTNLLETTRDQANKFHTHLMKRIKTEGISGNTANRRFGNIRKLFRVYANHLQLDVKNPFEGLSFSDPKRLRKTVPPFEIDFVERNFLSIDPEHGYALSGLNFEARCIFLITIETGCRPSEIANLKPENIHLKAKVPYISVKFMEDRRLKTENSIRDVPLIGVALEAMRLFPKGFPRYRDKETNLSGAVMNYLKDNKLLPTKNHRAYSTRHTYEKRMVEAGYDDEFRRRMLGHDTDRPDYGDGGSLAWRAERMAAIALKFDPAILTA
ncbi:tyrosine-type recombinase/integrase [Rhizobium leguminosarum bv. viciae]|nr:tyrosine-type recombinase/integrase [Rhizobium leguminosarum bv. viciae]